MNGGLSITTDGVFEENERIKIFKQLNFVFVFVEELVAEHEECKNMESELEVTMNEFQGYWVGSYVVVHTHMHVTTHLSHNYHTFYYYYFCY